MEDDTTGEIRVLFVCLGNICRSPLAEAVFRDVVTRRGLESKFSIDSAGTGSWHVGHPPDKRMQATALERGIVMSHLRARQFTEADFVEYDHIFGMDRDNVHDMLFLAEKHGTAERPNAYRVRVFREADPEPGDFQVPDPYYGGSDGFQAVYEMVHRTSEALADAFVRDFDL